MSCVPGGKVEKYLGNLNFFFIRECTSIRETGGICGFVHSFISEVLSIVRAHVTSLGGNAMIAFYLNDLTLHDNVHKNQVGRSVGHTLLSASAPDVHVTLLLYFRASVSSASEVMLSLPRFIRMTSE